MIFSCNKANVGEISLKYVLFWKELISSLSLVIMILLSNFHPQK